MSWNIPIGTKAEHTLLVSTDNAISFLGLDEARVLSTPNMILYMERTCRQVIKALLDDQHDTVGTHVNVYHLAGAPIGCTVTFRAEITGVDGRKVHFRVEAWNEGEKVGEGTHERTIINVAKFASRLAQKKADSRN